jgi:hypothetical protein
MIAMAIVGGFVLDSDWYWRIFEGEATLGDRPGVTAARDFVTPLARLAKDRVAIDAIAVDADGEGVSFRVDEHPVAIRCSNLTIDRFVEVINRTFAEAKVDLAFAIVESRRYELRGVLVPRGELRGRRFARGTTPPMT